MKQKSKKKPIEIKSQQLGTFKISIKCIVPADGIKGKTWGPSTLHQRERGHLPAMRQTSARAPQFSKSAPNLDKSRIAAAMLPNQQSTHQSTSGRMNVLGKSVEGLNTLSNGNGGSNAQRTDNKYAFEDFEEEESCIDEDEDDEDVEVKGCFGFIRSDDSYVKRKKYSLDSKMAEHQQSHPLSMLAASTSLASARFATATADDDYDDTNGDSANASFETCERNLDDVPYDRVFYRTIQKSLDEIFARDDYNQQFVSQRARNSKSSGDLTMCTAEEEEVYDSYRFQRLGSDSKFDRECFFVNHDESAGEEENGDGEVGDSDADRNASIKSNISFQEQELSQNSTDSPLHDSFASINLNGNSFGENNKHFMNRSFDERTNSMCSDQSSVDLSITPSASRKSSVTFRVDNGYRGGSHTSDTFHIPYHADTELAKTDVTAQFIPSARLATASQQPHYHPMKPIKGGGAQKSALAKKDKREKPAKSKYKGLRGLFKLTRNSTLLHSNSFYNKFENKTDLNEQLLVDDQPSTNVSHEPQYEAIFTRNFLLAKQNDK